MQVDFDKISDYLKENLYKYLYCVNGKAGFPTAQFIEDMKKSLLDNDDSDEKPLNGLYRYIAGKEPKFKVGDTISYYECTSDYEGETSLGTITNVEFDDDFEDWIYTFEDGEVSFEETLISKEAYK